MADSKVPELSVVIVTPSGSGTIKRTMACVSAQTVAERLEVVVVAPSESPVDPAALDTSRLGALQTVEIASLTQRGAAAAAGVHAARAPIVCLLENHSFPEPEWAAALLAAHRQPWAGVGPHVENANPGTALSRVSFWLSYASITGPQQAGTRELLPWHNSSYKRDVLTGYGERLAELLAWEGNLQEDLVARGLELYFEPAARTHHLNPSAVRPAFLIHLLHGRILGGQQAERERWSRSRRAVHAAALPLLPFLHLKYFRPEFRRLGIGGRIMLRNAPAFVALLAATAIGEAVGYLAGPGDAMTRFVDFDLWRATQLSRSDRWAMGTSRGVS